ncbi:hypothetical protein J4E93_001773 [Alternaria ventricosa]|uniref:uncharacterized protein n=1 Tax=Alternaria ventricosa TaxID=1187951 RepID=UPI0020C366AA|nr:uncharacterized protein J4E93_001773 [Alternaria ventricosa]KAI4654005.1 hypothetical protein J4E93_001773 [Alternaria ventricosa]
MLTIYSAAQTQSSGTSPVADSSPLSELPETPSLEVSSAMRGNDGRVEALKNDDGEESADESSDAKKPYACQYCGKTYVSEQKLKRHIRDTRSKCAKRRLGVSTSDSVFACPRCDAQMSKKYSIEPYKLAPRSSRAGTVAKDDKGKRKATDSPGASPKSKPVAKRATAVAKKETTTATGPSQEAGRLYPPFASQSDLERSPQYHMDIEKNIGGLRSSTHLQSRDHVPTTLHPQSTLMSQHVQRDQARGHPVPQQQVPIPPLIPGQQYNGRDVMTPQQALARWPNIHNSSGLMTYIVGRNGEVLNQSAIDGDELLKKLNAQQRRIAAMATRHNNGVRVPVPTRPAPQAPDEHRTQFNHVHSPESRLTRFRPIQCANFKVYEEAARRNIRPNEFLASAPGSRMPSRQTSAQPAAALHLPTQGQLQGMNTAAPATKGPVARELTQPIALQRSALPVGDENDPVMTLRIHSNTYDINGTPIFSILTIRASQKFGPRLEYYCQQRGKQYGIDWVFIYQYALGGPDDDMGARYIKIDYDMIFSDVHDPERPDIKLRDMDTIMIMKAKSRLVTMIEHGRNRIETPLSPTGSQVSEDNIDIVDGETPIFQNAGTIANWNRIVESKMMELRNQVNTLTSENQRQKTELARQNQMLGDMIKRNDASLRSSHPQVTGRGVHAFPFVGHSAANLHPGIQRGPTVQRNAFMDRLEAVREPTVLNDSRNRMQQYQFPTHHPGMQGRRPTYDSGEREAFPDFQRIGAATTQPTQFSAYGMCDDMTSYVPVLQHVQGGSDDMGAPVMKVEDVEMEE